jgi:uncharacterized protein
MLLRDPVHGDIYLTDAETRILDTREMQRLRGIKQLGTAYLVYPGCVHTRFDHSLGCLHMAKRILEHLRMAGHRIDNAEAAVALAAMLVHDVTHIPFGHTFEDERQIFPRHDAGPRLLHFLSPSRELGKTLLDLGLLDEVQAILAGNARLPWMTEVVSSTVDADLLDYVRRDSFFAGLRQDFDDRIFSYFTLEDGHLCMNMTKHGLDRPDARSEILHLLRMRYMLTERIYLHHAKIASGAMISKALELAARRGLTEEALYDLGDQTFLELLARHPGEAVIAQLIEGVLARRLYKRAYVLSSVSLGPLQASFIQRYAGQSEQRQALEERLAREAGVRPGHVIVYCPKASYFKEAEVSVKSRLGIRPLNTLEPAEAGDVGALARQYADLWRFYVFAPPPKAEAVRQACRRHFDLESEYL